MHDLVVARGDFRLRRGECTHEALMGIPLELLPVLEEVGEVHVPNHEDDVPVLPGGYVPFPHGGEFPPNGLVGLPQGLLETVEGVGTVYVEFADGQVVHELFAEDTTGAEGENLVSRVIPAKEIKFRQEPVFQCGSAALSVDVLDDVWRIFEPFAGAGQNVLLIFGDDYPVFAPFGSFFIFLVLRASVEAGLSCFGISVLGFAFQGYKTPAYPGSECLAQILFLCLTKSMRRFLGGSFSWTGSFEPESMNVFLPAFQSLVGGGIERSH